MAICKVCGSEVSGPYCDMCGAKAPEEVAARQPRGETRRNSRPEVATDPGPVLTIRAENAVHTRQTPKARPGVAVKDRTVQPAAPPPRWWAASPAFAAIVGVLLFVAGLGIGYWIAARPATLTSTAIDNTAASSLAPPSPDQPAVVQAERWMDIGIDAMDKGQRTAAVENFRKAITQFEKALQETPDNLYARSYLGLVYFYAGDDTKAIATDQEVLAKDPNYLWAIFNLAWIYQSTGKSAEALGMYQKYLNAATTEKANKAKYAEQYELIDRQIEASKQAVAKLQGGGTQ